METSVANKLIALNRQFYQTFALQFSATRMRIQPGVRQILGTIPPNSNILDLGCGNGELGSELVRIGHKGQYLGLDSSPELLAIARERLTDSRYITFMIADLSAIDWEIHILDAPFDVIVAFAVLHHIPSATLRKQILYKIRHLLKPKGLFVHSEWQFLNSQRLRSRIQPWDLIGLNIHDIEPNDYLLDWREGGYGLRYVHHFSEDELAQLATEIGFSICDTFLSDGENSRLGLYQVWQSID